MNKQYYGFSSCCLTDLFGDFSDIHIITNLYYLNHHNYSCRQIDTCTNVSMIGMVVRYEE